MVKKHLKQLSAPKSWPLLRKSSTFVTRPAPGAHGLDTGIPLGLALTNLLHVAKTTPEAKSILYKHEVLVDQIKRKDHRFIVGFMDTITLPASKESYRLFRNNKGVLIAHKIDMKEASIKLARVNDKKILGKDKIQLNLDYGRNIIVKKDEYSVGDTLVIELPSQKIVKKLSLETGATALLLSTKHMGLVSEIVEIKGSEVLVKSGEETFLTHKRTVLVVGKGKPEIDIPAK